MKLPRKGILIRLGIYLPIIGFLAWQAFFKDKPQPEPKEVPKGNVQVFFGPNGEEIEVPVISEEEARAMGIEVPEHPPKAAEDGAEAPNDPQ